jgi:hypothetical protein
MNELAKDENLDSENRLSPKIMTHDSVGLTNVDRESDFGLTDPYN